MPTAQDSTRILRVAAKIWIGYLLAMLLMDFVLYGLQSRLPFVQSVAFQAPLNPQGPPPGSRLWPIFLFYTANGLVALAFLLFTHWDWIQAKLGEWFYPTLLFAISAAPIVINTLIAPRFPPGPLSNAEGMALRQLPVLFVALALVAWQYQLLQIILFSVATTGLEFALILFSSVGYRNSFFFFFIAVIRTIIFMAAGIFINLLMTRLREQSASLRQANLNLGHYAATLEQLTVSRERNRLARELHDTLAHSLTALSISLETAKAYFDLDREKTRGLIESSLEATRKGADETRRALKALRSSDLEDLGLTLAIQRIAESTAARFNLKLQLDLPTSQLSLSPDVEQTIYRITQEALENIVNHSRAKNFSVQLSHAERTTLIITDDGVGFNVKAKSPAGRFGLVGMYERAELAGGILRIESAGASHGQKSSGTKITLTISSAP
ncbi:MAG: sensor histidine kinase [Anaerolineales bacterium]|nr:sensor histidine kinase [Anaerolineales bacterium]